VRCAATAAGGRYPAVAADQAGVAQSPLCDHWPKALDYVAIVRSVIARPGQCNG
jgi:hypothetical protein